MEPCSTAVLTALPWEEDDDAGPFVLSSWKIDNLVKNRHARAESATYVRLFEVTNVQILKEGPGLVGVADILKGLSGITP